MTRQALLIFLGLCPLPAQLASSQEFEQLTQEQFNQRIDDAFESRTLQTVEHLIRHNKYRVHGRLVKYLNAYIKATVSTNEEEAAKHLSHAQQMADIFYRIFGGTQHRQRIKQWQTWSTHEKLSKMKGDSLVRAGFGLYRKGKYDEATACFTQAYDRFLRLGDRYGQVQALNRNGIVHVAKGDYSRATFLYDQSLQLAREIGYDKAIWININSKGNIEQRQANIQEARKLYEQAYAIIKVVGEKKDFLVGLGNLGLIHYVSGDYVQAANYYLQSVHLSQEVGDGYYERTGYTNLGNLYFELDQHELALEYYQRALEIAQSNDFRFGEASSLNNIGTVFLIKGAHETARAKFEQALTISEEIDSKMLIEISMTNLGEVHKETMNYEVALDYFRRASTIQTEIDDKTSMAIGFGEIAEIYKERLNFEKAFEYYQRALHLAFEIGSPYEIWSAQRNLGEAFKEQGKPSAALQHLTSAVSTIESHRARLDSDAFKTSFLDGKISTYEALIDLLVTLKRAEEAFNYSERAKARALLDVLSLDRFDLTDGFSPELLRKKKEAERELLGIHDRISRHLANSGKQQDPIQLTALQDSLRFAKSQYDMVLREIKQKHPNLVRLEKQPLTLHQIQDKILAESMFVVEYFVTDERTFVWVVGKYSFHLEEIRVTRDTLKRMVSDLLQPFHDVQPYQNAADFQFDLNLAKQLHEALFFPIEKYLAEAATVVIVPDDILFYLPFETLVTDIDRKEPDKDVIYSRYEHAHYLIERFPISYVPSASVLDPDVLPHNRADRAGGLIMANPNFGGEKFEITLQQMKLSLLNLVAILTKGSKENTWVYPRLPFSEREAREISAAIPASKVLTGSDATEEAFKELAGQYRFIHLSSHAVTEENQPMYSRIVFALDEDPGEDGFFHAYELLNLNLNADLVTLSGCETGLGKWRRGEGLIGLTRSFMYAGTPSVLVSLWSVDDASTSVLMSHFYENLGRGKTKGEALRQAKLAMLRTRKDGISYAMPFFWAPFVLIGEGNKDILTFSEKN